MGRWVKLGLRVQWFSDDVTWMWYLGLRVQWFSDDVLDVVFEYFSLESIHQRFLMRINTSAQRWLCWQWYSFRESCSNYWPMKTNVRNAWANILCYQYNIIKGRTGHYQYSKSIRQSVHCKTRVVTTPVLLSLVTVDCHFDNLLCHQWQQGWYHGDSQFSVYPVYIAGYLEHHLPKAKGALTSQLIWNATVWVSHNGYVRIQV